MDFDSQKFNEFILENGVIGFFEEPITLVGGRLTNHYVNWRNVAKDTFLLEQSAEHLLAFVEQLGLKPKCFVGAPEGATKLAVLTQYKWAKAQPDYGPCAYPIAMARAKPKEHGQAKDKFFVGVPESPTIVIEDTTTTAGTLIRTIESVRAAGVEVIAAIVLVNRNEVRDDGLSAKEAVEALGVPYHALANFKELLPFLYERLQPSPTVKQAVETYFATYGQKD